MIYIYDSMKQVKRLFEFIVDLQKTTHKKLSKMDRRQKATFQMVKEIDSRLRRVEEHLHIPRPPVARHDPDDDDDDDDDDGGSFHMYYPSPPPPQQGEGVRQSPIDVGQSAIHEEDEGDQQPPHRSPQQEEEQGDQQPPHRSPHQEEEQGDQQPPQQSPQQEEEQGDQSHMILGGVSAADTDREHDQVDFVSLLCCILKYNWLY